MTRGEQPDCLRRAFKTRSFERMTFLSCDPTLGRAFKTRSFRRMALLGFHPTLGRAFKTRPFRRMACFFPQSRRRASK